VRQSRLSTLLHRSRCNLKPITRLILTALLATPIAAYADWESSILPKDFHTASSLTRAIENGKQSGRPIILYYTRTSCPPCDVLQARLRKEDVAKPYRESYIFTAVWGSSMGQMDQQRYRDRYGARGAPSWIVFTSDGRYVCTAVGGFKSDEAGAVLHKAIQAKVSAPSKEEPASIASCI
jgi:hypothetical protein